MCRASAKLERDREYSRVRRQAKPQRRAPPVDDEPAIARPAPENLKAIQPKAVTLVQERAAAFVRWMGDSLLSALSSFCFLRGLTELDRVEIIKSLLSETEVAPEEIPPDPPEPLDEDRLIDVFAD